MSPSPNSVPLLHSKDRCPSVPPAPAIGDTARRPRLALERRAPAKRHLPPNPTAPKGAVVAIISSISPESRVLNDLPHDEPLPRLLVAAPSLRARRPRRGTESPSFRLGLVLLGIVWSPCIAFIDAVYLVHSHMHPTCDALVAHTSVHQSTPSPQLTKVVLGLRCISWRHTWWQRSGEGVPRHRELLPPPTPTHRARLRWVPWRTLPLTLGTSRSTAGTQPRPSPGTLSSPDAMPPTVCTRRWRG